MYGQGGGCGECERVRWHTVSKQSGSAAEGNGCRALAGGACIPGYPDRNLPTLLVYRDRDVVLSFIGLQAYGGAEPPAS